MGVQLRQEETKYVLHVGSESSQHIFTSLPGYISAIGIYLTVRSEIRQTLFENFNDTKMGAVSILVSG